MSFSNESQSFNNNPRPTTAFTQYQITNSTLEPSAPEFRPSNQVSTGAVKRKPQNTNRRNNYYGSGRIFNGSRYEEPDGDNSRNPNENRRYENHQYKRYEERSYKANRKNYNTYERKDESIYYNNEKRDHVKYYNGKKYANQRNWRKFHNTPNGNLRNNKKCNGNAASQRERLEDMLNRRKLECLVCCEKIKNSDKIWSCIQCYNILHLDCTIAWAKSSQINNGWRCPACQNVCIQVPLQYFCYCGKITDPKPDNGVIAHSCGEICLRKGRTCDHKCTILCHPGPCPDCTVMVSKSCACGVTESQLKCSTDLEMVCDNVCNKLLTCGLHKCNKKCHWDDCPPCSETVQQECYCGKVGRRVKCTSDVSGITSYSCGETCNKLLSCGNHKCSEICHENECKPCSNDINLIKTCPCGKHFLEIERKSCLDPVPCCGKVCGKFLKCGQPNTPHKCEELCHLGDCPTCPKTTLVRCRCGHMDKELPCKDLVSKADDARCEKKCTKVFNNSYEIFVVA